MERATTGDKIRLRSLIVGSYTAEEWQRRFKSLSEADQFRMWAHVEPKEIKVDSETTISLIINGVRQVNAIDGTAPKELIAHDDLVQIDDPETSE
jgi:hypothetical protein